MNTAKNMRRDWNERARKNAFHYIASWQESWDRDSFFASGEEDYRNLVAPFLELCHWSPECKSILELGCGTGRMTRSFAERFHKVYALDISEEMLKRGQSYVPEFDNIVWLQGNGTDLTAIETQSVDFSFSYIVLQHLPRPALVFRYVNEMMRVLKPGGLFLFQFNSLRTPAMNWKGRVGWACVDVPWKLGFRRASRHIASLLKFDSEIAGASWRGASISVKRMAEAVQRAGGTVKDTRGGDTPMAWIGGTKS